MKSWLCIGNRGLPWLIHVWNFEQKHTDILLCLVKFISFKDCIYLSYQKSLPNPRSFTLYSTSIFFFNFKICLYLWSILSWFKIYAKEVWIKTSISFACSYSIVPGPFTEKTTFRHLTTLITLLSNWACMCDCVTRLFCTVDLNLSSFTLISPHCINHCSFKYKH